MPANAPAIDIVIWDCCGTIEPSGVNDEGVVDVRGYNYRVV